MIPVIAAHGIGPDARFFTRQVEGLVPRPVIGFNMPGYGGTPGIGSLTFPALAESLAAAVDDAGGSAHLCGHSMGGMIALELAATRPELCRSLILCNTTPAFGGRDDSFRDAFVSARLAPLDSGLSMAEVAQSAMASMCGAETSASDIAFLADVMAQTPEPAYRSAIECLVTFNRRDALETLSMPVLCIGGTDDQAAPARTMERMAEKIPGAQCHILPGGH
ncbi:MAG: alpha/beta hydrolase, partial [Pseudomonadota bacterium]